jgi:hypothetical protein
MASSMRLTASSNPSEAKRQLRPNAVLKSSSWILVMVDVLRLHQRQLGLVLK